MWNKIALRHNLIGVIASLYTVPLVVMIAYDTWFSHASRWTLLAVGLLLVSVGTLIFFSLLLQWEQNSKTSPHSIAPSPPAPPQEEELEELEELEESAETEVPIDEEELPNYEEELASLQKKLEEAHEKQQEYLEEITYRNEELQKLTQERDLHQREHEKLHEEFQQYRKISEETLEEEKNQAHEYQETISQQRATIEQKQQRIEHLDNKIRDLTYEIKTLLQLADMGSSGLATHDDQPSKHGFTFSESATEFLVPLDISYEDTDQETPTTTVHNDDDAKKLLKRSIDIAQKITGSHHFGSSKSRFGDLALDNYALDLRRLCDSLRSETAGSIFVYSPKDNKLLFSNNQVKELLGWSPEKFVLDFETIVQEGIFEWKSAVSQLSSMNSTATRLVMKAKSGHDLLLHCKLGLIPTGVFRNNVIGVLYQD